MSAPRIGLDMVHFAKLLEDPVNGKAKYAPPVRLAGLMNRLLSRIIPLFYLPPNRQ